MDHSPFPPFWNWFEWFIWVKREFYTGFFHPVPQTDFFNAGVFSWDVLCSQQLHQPVITPLLTCTFFFKTHFAIGFIRFEGVFLGLHHCWLYLLQTCTKFQHIQTPLTPACSTDPKKGPCDLSWAPNLGFSRRPLQQRHCGSVCGHSNNSERRWRTKQLDSVAGTSTLQHQDWFYVWEETANRSQTKRETKVHSQQWHFFFSKHGSFNQRCLLFGGHSAVLNQCFSASGSCWGGCLWWRAHTTSALSATC